MDVRSRPTALSEIKKLNRKEQTEGVANVVTHSACWFLDIKFKEYSRSIQALKTAFSRSIQSKFTLSCTMFRNVFIGQ